MTPITVYFPAVGGEPTIAAAEALRAEWPGPEPLRLLGCDTDPDKKAVVKLDGFGVSPRRDDPAYLPFLLEQCAREHVDVLWPNSTEEQLFAIEHRQALEARSVRVLLPPFDAVRVLADKQRTYEIGAAIGIAVPKWRPVANWLQLCQAAEDFGYPEHPVVFRRTFGKGGIGLRILSETAPSQRDFFCRQSDGMTLPLSALRHSLAGSEPWPPCIVCEFLPGLEYDIDCLIVAGVLRGAVARRNDAMWWGTSSRAETVDRPDLIALCGRLLEKLRWTYICSATFRENAHGRPVLLEVNGRMPACINLSWRAGCNFPVAALLHCLGRETQAFPAATPGVRLIRYFGEAFLNPVREGNQQDGRPSR